VPLTALFLVLTLAFAGIAVASAVAGRWPIAVAAGALAAWTATLVTGALRRMRK
jgi:hypothetical protein